MGLCFGVVEGLLLVVPRTVGAQGIHSSIAEGANGRLVSRPEEIDPRGLLALTLGHLRLEILKLDLALFRGTPLGVVLHSAPRSCHGLTETSSASADMTRTNALARRIKLVARQINKAETQKLSPVDLLVLLGLPPALLSGSFTFWRGCSVCYEPKFYSGV